ncbi:MAG: hypothetical protein IT581_08895 [Verrucomicrobiales bacterium]|nr:hypothetical protein [Verrucomicrobiales bacterium]
MHQCDLVGGTTVGEIGNPLGDPNARLDIRDPRVAPFVSLPSAMLEGESRRMWMDLKGLFRSVFPAVEPSNVIFTGAYVGTEQYGRLQCMPG